MKLRSVFIIENSKLQLFHNITLNFNKAILKEALLNKEKEINYNLSSNVLQI